MIFILRLIFICILLLFIVRIFYYKKSRVQININSNNYSIYLFLIYSNVDLIFVKRSLILDLYYFSFLPLLFIIQFLARRFKWGFQIFIVAISSLIVSVLRVREFIQLSYIIAILILLYYSIVSFQKSSKFRFWGYLYLSFAFFYFCVNLQFVLYNYSTNWISSKILYYYSVTYYTVLISLLIIIHAYFRRLFFN